MKRHSVTGGVTKLMKTAKSSTKKAGKPAIKTNGKATKKAVEPKHRARKATNGTPAPVTEGAKQPREGSKKGLVISLVERPEGATRTELSKATEWSGQFVHGFISWTVAKYMEKTGRAIDASKDKATGEWTYKVK